MCFRVRRSMGRFATPTSNVIVTRDRVRTKRERPWSLFVTVFVLLDTAVIVWRERVRQERKNRDLGS